MQVLRPGETTREEWEAREQERDATFVNVQITDDQLRAYADHRFLVFRQTLEQYFPTLAQYVPAYVEHPFDTYVLKLGEHGIIMGHRPATGAYPTTRVMRLEDFDPPLPMPLNMFDVLDRWGTRDYYSFDFSGRLYGNEEAEFEGVRQAFASVRHIFWHALDVERFKAICLELLKAEGVTLEHQTSDTQQANEQIDVVGDLLLAEPAWFRRIERWGFRLHHHESDRITPDTLQAAEAYINVEGNVPDVLCLVTSGDLTSIGNHLASRHNRLRIWDRPVLDMLITEHRDVVVPYFPSYVTAVSEIEEIWKLRAQAAEAATRFAEFKVRLEACPGGQADFRTYEQIGKEIWEYLFTPDVLGPGKEQPTTEDRKQRRDVLFRNMRSTTFWQRVFEKHNADFIIVDFKNYSEPVGPEVIDDVQKYASKALGWFIIVVSRKGYAPAFKDAQIRKYKDTIPGVVVLVVSDNEMLEMLSRKENGEAPDDVIQDIYEEFLLRC